MIITEDESEREGSDNPYLDSDYSREYLLDLLNLTTYSLNALSAEKPNSPTIQSYQITIKLIALALAFRKK